jgi:non-specific serine/threonine protein kinase/serine/threonine-protein kinase
LRLLGEGGMGEVWEAAQTDPVRREVALKLIKWGMDTKAVIARFEAERQALALWSLCEENRSRATAIETD